MLLAYVMRRAAFAGVPGRLSHGLFVKGLGWLLAAATLGIAYAMLFTNHHGQYGALSLLIVSFGIGATYVLLEAYGTYGSFDANGIALRTPWTGRRSGRWPDLVTVKFRPRLGWYDLVFKDGTTIRLSSIIQGYGAALQEMERHKAVPTVSDVHSAQQAS